MTQRYLPGAKIGVMGGGQLGRMFAMAARRMGYRVHIFSPEENGPAAQLADESIVADYADENAVRKFAQSVDLITFEFENIPIQTIEWCEEICDVRPSGQILHTAQNRLREKDFLAGAGFPLAPYRTVETAQDLTGALEEIGAPAILKSAAFGYDGKGQQKIATVGEAANISQLDGEHVLERQIDFAMEISVIVARSSDGSLATFPVCENVHRNHILDLTVAPARIAHDVEMESRELARAIARKLDLVGLLAIEMFLQADGKLLVNELAPRPHNSGHWTIEGCQTSQFEQHVRAVCGLPLGATAMLRPSAMVNLLGDLWRGGEPNWNEALKVPGAHLHLYGKADPRPRRKMGHITALTVSANDAVILAKRARRALLKK